MGFRSRARERRRKTEVIDNKPSEPTQRRFVVHRGSIDRIDNILKSGKFTKLEGRSGISFTKGIPLVPGHGDTALFFDYDWLKSSGCELKNIDYKNRSDLKKYSVIENPKGIREKAIEQLRFHNENYNLLLQNNPFPEQKNDLLQGIIENDKMISFWESQSDQSVIENQVRQFGNWENEILALTDELFFEPSDIIGIVTLRRYYCECFSSLSEFEDRTVFSDDIIRYVPGEPQSGWSVLCYRNDNDGSRSYPGLDKRISTASAIGKGLDPAQLEAYHVACSLVEKMDEYYEYRDMELPGKAHLERPPKEFIDELENLVNLPNDWFKAVFLDHFSSRLKLNNEQRPIIDQLILSEFKKRLV